VSSGTFHRVLKTYIFQLRGANAKRGQLFSNPYFRSCYNEYVEYSKDNLKEFMLKEIEVIQDIIKRMASNSFLIKGWCLTLVVATLLISGKALNSFIAFIPLITFWILDAYFLQQEKLYRSLYKWVISNRMKTSDFLFDMNTSRFKESVPKIFRLMFSFTLGLFYVSIFSITIIFILVIKLKKGWF